MQLHHEDASLAYLALFFDIVSRLGLPLRLEYTEYTRLNSLNPGFFDC